MSDMPLSEAIAELSKLANMGRAWAKLDEVGVAFSSAEQLVRERGQRSDQLLQQIADLESRFNQLQNASNEAEHTAKDRVDAATRQAAQILADGEAESKSALEAANAALGVVNAQAADATTQRDVAIAARDAAHVAELEALERIKNAKAAALAALG